MSVNFYDWGTDKLNPTAGLTVPAPTPDYVDEQYSSSKTYSKGMTCISGNVRYRYKNSTASSGHTPPNATYWEVCSVANQLNNIGLKVVTKTYNCKCDGNARSLASYLGLTKSEYNTIIAEGYVYINMYYEIPVSPEVFNFPYQHYFANNGDYAPAVGVDIAYNATYGNINQYRSITTHYIFAKI